MITVAQTQENSAEAIRSKILFVDDEANILSALNRLFRPLGHQIFTANSGAQGLELLATETMDLVVSDMRMPEMDGAQFLAQVANQWPDTIRILLTGYADINSTVSAINNGAIYRYVSKPWEENDLKLTVQRALEQKNFQEEKKRLNAIITQQNEELKALNANLEERVQARTEEVRQTAAFLDMAYEDLKNNYKATIPIFANLIELRDGDFAGHSRRVAEDAKLVAQQLKLSEEEVENIYFAALLHDIGKIGLPDTLFNKPFNVLAGDELEQVKKHPIFGQEALMALDPLQDAGKILRSHHERYDGQGYPDGLKGEAIPIGARILTVVNDYDALQLGTLVDSRMRPLEARAFLKANRGTRYDTHIVDIFIAVLDKQVQQVGVAKELRLASIDLREGMMLAQDLVTPDGVLLLSKGQCLRNSIIDRIRHFERMHQRGYTISIYPPEG